MSTRDYENWNSKKATPGFQAAFVPAPADIVELPSVITSEGEEAAEAFRRFYARRLAWWKTRRLA